MSFGNTFTNALALDVDCRGLAENRHREAVFNSPLTSPKWTFVQVRANVCFRPNAVILDREHLPISVNNYTTAKDGGERNEIAWLADDDWELPSQFAELENWIQSTGKGLPAGNYVIDVGFSPREGATGGGGVLSVESMRVMVEKGMELHISEYPPSSEEPAAAE